MFLQESNFTSFVLLNILYQRKNTGTDLNDGNKINRLYWKICIYIYMYIHIHICIYAVMLLTGGLLFIDPLTSLSSVV